MRPGVSDQLRGIRRILEDVIAPELRTGYPSQTLRGVVKNLAMLERAWSRVHPFLVWDTGETAKLLTEAVEFVDEGLSTRISRALSQEIADHLSMEQLEERNALLRELLGEAIAGLADRPHTEELLSRIKDHFVERMDRYPFRMALARPTSDKS